MLATGLKNWVPMLENCVNHLNSQIIPGTRFRPKDVTYNNLQKFLEQKWRVPTYTSLLNTSMIRSTSIKNAGWLKKLFAFEVGEEVLLSRQYAGSRGAFFKATSIGNFTEETYVISDRFIATTRRLRAIPGCSWSSFARLLRLTFPVVFFAQSTRSREPHRVLV